MTKIGEQELALLVTRETAGEPDAPVTPDAVALSGADAISLRWADDVYFVYDLLGEKPSKAKAGTGARFALWQYAKKNIDDFIGQMLPKAMTIRDRAKAKDPGSDAILAACDKEVSRLGELLAEAVAESLRGEI